MCLAQGTEAHLRQDFELRQGFGYLRGKRKIGAKTRKESYLWYELSVWGYNTILPTIMQTLLELLVGEERVNHTWQVQKAAQPPRKSASSIHAKHTATGSQTDGSCLEAQWLHSGRAVCMRSKAIDITALSNRKIGPCMQSSGAMR